MLADDAGGSASGALHDYCASPGPCPRRVLPSCFGHKSVAWPSVYDSAPSLPSCSLADTDHESRAANVKDSGALMYIWWRLYGIYSLRSRRRR